MNNNMFSNNNYVPYGTMGSIYPGQPAPQPRNTQPLTQEEINELKKHVEKFTTAITREEILRAYCTHRNNNESMLVPTGKPDEYECAICGAKIVLKPYTDEEVQAITDEYENILNNIKVKFMDIPIDVTKSFFQIMPYVKKSPQLYQLANDNYSRYANGFNNSTLNPVNGSPNYAIWNNFYAMQGGYPGMGYGYQQPAMGYPQMMPQQQMNMGQPMMNGMGSTTDMQRDAMLMGGNPLYSQYPQGNPQMMNAPVQQMPQNNPVQTQQPVQDTNNVDNSQQSATTTTTQQVAL